MDTIKDYYSLDQEIPDHLPLLDFLVSRYKKQQPLKNITALFFQHQLSDQVPMVRALIDLGLSAENIYWVDIPYTSNKCTRDALKKLGDINFFTCEDYDLLHPYAAYQRRRAIKIYKKMLSLNPERLLVLDDGAYFLEAASYFENRPSRCVIVEQTSRGMIKLENNKAMQHLLKYFPIINVARSTLKSKLESPFIGKSVCAALDYHLEPYLKKSKKTIRCLILGYGNIGRAVAQHLKSIDKILADNIFIHDTNHNNDDSDNNKIHDIDLYNKWDHSNQETFDLVIGCTGNTSFDFGDYVLLNNNAVLVSASSGAIEFNRRNMIEQGLLSELDDVWIGEIKNDRCLHSDISIHFPGRDVTLLNGGFPINFDGRMTISKSNQIQITSSLMLEAAVMSTTLDEGAHGIQELNTETCIELAMMFYKDNEKQLKHLIKSIITD